MGKVEIVGVCVRARDAQRANSRLLLRKSKNTAHISLSFKAIVFYLPIAGFRVVAGLTWRLAPRSSPQCTALSARRGPTPRKPVSKCDRECPIAELLPSAVFAGCGVRQHSAVRRYPTAAAPAHIARPIHSWAHYGSTRATLNGAHPRARVCRMYFSPLSSFSSRKLVELCCVLSAANSLWVVFSEKYSVTRHSTSSCKQPCQNIVHRAFAVEAAHQR